LLNASLIIHKFIHIVNTNLKFFIIFFRRLLHRPQFYHFYSCFPSGKAGTSSTILILNAYLTNLPTLLSLILCHNEGFTSNVVSCT